MTDTRAPDPIGSVLGLYCAQFGTQALGFGARVLLARLLIPADFGVFALGLCVLGVARTIQDLGLGARLIREPADEGRTTLRLQGGAALALGLLLALGRDLARPLDPALPTILPILALTLLPDALSGVATALLGRSLHLRRTVRPELGALAGTAVVSVAGAALGAGLWSLVAGQVAGSLLRLALLWRWLPPFRGPWRGSLARAALAGGRYFLLLNVTGLLLQDLDKALLGGFANAQAVGYYTVAFALVYLVPRTLEAPLRQVAFPLFARHAADRGRLQHAYEALTLLCLGIELPLAAALWLQAGPVVRLLYGAQWTPTAPLVTGMCLLALVDPFSKFGGTLLQATRREGLQYWVSLPYTAFFIGAAWVLTQRYGVTGLICANYLQVGGWILSGPILRTLPDPRPLLLRVAGLYGLCGGMMWVVAWYGSSLPAGGQIGLLCAVVWGIAVSTLLRSQVRYGVRLIRDDWRRRHPAQTTAAGPSLDLQTPERS